ncbi:hypothetical protein BaRGS_00002309, partial [Batillaria attramentaria]
MTNKERTCREAQELLDISVKVVPLATRQIAVEFCLMTAGLSDHALHSLKSRGDHQVALSPFAAETGRRVASTSDLKSALGAPDFLRQRPSDGFPRG